MPADFLLLTPRLRLRPLRSTDLAVFAAYRADPEVARYQSWESYSRERAVQFLAAQAEAGIPAAPGAWAQIGIADAATDELLGDCALHLLADEPRVAEIGITLSRAAQGQGYGREALHALFTYCFAELKLHRLIGITDCLNTGSVRLLESVGMRREAHFRQNIWFKGAWGDEYVYAMLRDEWPPAG